MGHFGWNDVGSVSVQSIGGGHTEIEDSSYQWKDEGPDHNEQAGQNRPGHRVCAAKPLVYYEWGVLHNVIWNWRSVLIHLAVIVNHAHRKALRQEEGRPILSSIPRVDLCISRRRVW